MSAMLCNSELIKCKREKQFSILCVASHKVFYQATQLMCKLRHDSIQTRVFQQELTSCRLGWGLVLYSVRDFSNKGIIPSDLTLKLTSLFPNPYSTLRGFAEKNWWKTGLATLRHTSHTLHKELSELCKQLRLKKNRKARALNTCLVIVLED